MYHARNSADWRHRQKLEEARGALPWAFRRSMSLLTPWSWTSSLWTVRGQSLLSSATQFVVLCYSSSGKVIDDLFPALILFIFLKTGPFHNFILPEILFHQWLCKAALSSSQILWSSLTFSVLAFSPRSVLTPLSSHFLSFQAYAFGFCAQWWLVFIAFPLSWVPDPYFQTFPGISTTYTSYTLPIWNYTICR